MKIGSKHSKKTKEKIGNAHRGKIISKKQREIMSKKFKGKKNPFYGKKHSPTTRLKMCKNHADFSSSKNPHWKDGIRKNKGYIYIHQPSHPRADKDGYVKRANLVMEKIIGRLLAPKEIVHHKNGIKDDDRPENLKLCVNHSEHSKLTQQNLTLISAS